MSKQTNQVESAIQHMKSLFILFNLLNSSFVVCFLFLQILLKIRQEIIEENLALETRGQYYSKSYAKKTSECQYQQPYPCRLYPNRI